MKIAILSRWPDLYSTSRLAEEAKNRSHEVHIIDTLRCYMNITAHTPSIHYRGDTLSGFDAVIPRIGASITFYGTAVLRQFETTGVFTVNQSIAINRSRDKLRCIQLLTRKGLGLPHTGIAHSHADIDDLIAMVGGAPLIIKVLEGTQGIGVILAETARAAQSVIETFLRMRAHIIIQEYIKEATGADIRCLVVGGKVVAAIRRQAKPGEFRSNLHRGGKASVVTVTEEERLAAEKAAKIMGLNVAGVDLLRSNRGSLVLEVNSSPGLRGVEQTTKINVADSIIDFIEREAEHNSEFIEQGR
jgi:ribosomal protein S6--L-glutamate ligase